MSARSRVSRVSSEFAERARPGRSKRGRRRSAAAMPAVFIGAVLAMPWSGCETPGDLNSLVDRLTHPSSSSGDTPESGGVESASSDADGVVNGTTDSSGDSVAAATDGSGGESQNPNDDLTATGDDTDDTPPVGTYVPGRLLVKFRNVAAEHAQRALDQSGARVRGEIPSIGVKIVELPEQASEMAHLQAFRQRPE